MKIAALVFLVLIVGCTEKQRANLDNSQSHVREIGSSDLFLEGDTVMICLWGYDDHATNAPSRRMSFGVVQSQWYGQRYVRVYADSQGHGNGWFSFDVLRPYKTEWDTL